MTEMQKAKLIVLCMRYGMDFDASHYGPTFDLPSDYVAGWIGGQPGTLYVGVSPTGEASS